MLTRAELDALAAQIPADPDLTRLLRTLERRAAPVVAAVPPIPRVKALLSRDGGRCPRDGAPLRFDPWSPERHVCSRCGEAVSGDRHQRHWARAQHLWLAERAAELALLAGVTGNPAAAKRAADLLEAYETLYFELPNQDNVLGPSHLFFSTYLESLWTTAFLAAATLLRQADALPPARVEGISRIAEEAANLIGEFNEGLSNRQTWHAAALAAIAVWFEDAELLSTAVESRTGLLGHLADGFGTDGLWWEGENYHLFALRGLLQGMHWARAMEYDLLGDPEVRAHFRAALLAPARTALPDLTYPARRDARYGVSLAQPASLELWEVGRAWLDGDEELDSWLAALYAAPAPNPGPLYDAWLHDAGLPAQPDAPAPRSGLSWWALTVMQPAPPGAPPWRPESGLFTGQGLAILRTGDTYASLECGPAIGGHGHPDRLHLTVHSGGVHWLPDPGTGSYVEPVLEWYRSALAHNAPLQDGVNAADADAWCDGFATEAGWGWCRGKAGPFIRTLIVGPTSLVDLLEWSAAEPHRVELPCHFQGALRFESAGNWHPVELRHPFVSAAERDVPADPGALRSLRATRAGRSLSVLLWVPGADLIRATAPGLPTDPPPVPQPFLLLTTTAEVLRWAVVLDFAPDGTGDSVTGLDFREDTLEVTTGRGMIRYRLAESGLAITANGRTISLGGLRPKPRPPRSLFEPPVEPEVAAWAPRIAEPPALDGTLQGFDDTAPLELASEAQYRRSEAPYDPERFSATAWLNWDGDAVYLAVDVLKAELVLREADAPPLDLDNLPEDINSDGVQVYFRSDDRILASLINPLAGGQLYHRPIEGADPLEVAGRWARTESGYRMTLKLADPRFAGCWTGARLGFDLLINEMQPGRIRRSGQLVWSGGGGWIYLRGDRHEVPAAAVLELG